MHQWGVCFLTHTHMKLWIDCLALLLCHSFAYGSEKTVYLYLGPSITLLFYFAIHLHTDPKKQFIFILVLQLLTFLKYNNNLIWWQIIFHQPFPKIYKAALLFLVTLFRKETTLHGHMKSLISWAAFSFTFYRKRSHRGPRHHSLPTRGCLNHSCSWYWDYFIWITTGH